MEQQIRLSQYNSIPEVKKMIDLDHDISIYDTTLRDGEQMPGVSFTPEQKKDIAFLMDEMKVPQIELGFPAVSDQEFKTIKEINDQGLKAKTLALCRLIKPEVDTCVDAGVDTILLFIGTSDLHMEYKLKKCERELNDCVEDVVSYAKDRGVEVSFSTEDTTRSRLEVIHKMNNAAVNAGAVRIGITDTVGCASPQAVSYLVGQIKSELPNNITLGLHLHNDYGMALANAFAGVSAGANAVATTVSGIGERSGNVSLEEFICSLKFLYNVDLGVDLTRMKELANRVHEYIGHPLPPKSPLVGDNAFTHESGIHVSAILNHPRTYESIPPDLVGNTRRLIMGKHSGKAIVEKKLEERGIELTQDQICIVLRQIKILGDYKGMVGDEEFWNIVEMVRK